MAMTEVRIKVLRGEWWAENWCIFVNLTAISAVSVGVVALLLWWF